MQDFLILTTFLAGFCLILSIPEGILYLVCMVFPGLRAKVEKVFGDDFKDDD